MASPAEGGWGNGIVEQAARLLYETDLLRMIVPASPEEVPGFLTMLACSPTLAMEAQMPHDRAVRYESKLTKQSGNGPWPPIAAT